ncbi:unnamed protein product [Rotaria magnacalcarata]|uniref:Uncharacterized protein n=2 Tax=Rotaria magnacalcarata TaxID=392030 RepID=A0A820FS58_9BILA|nr:unnamed protein product [Rotaria magnacalcarata]
MCLLLQQYIGMAFTLERIRIDISEDDSCFFASKLPEVICSDASVTFASLLTRSNETPADCGSELEHLLVLAGLFDLKLKTICNHAICSNHRRALLNMWHRKNNCNLCTEVFNKNKRSSTNIRRVSKTIALCVWHNQRLNVYHQWFCTSCRIACTAKYNDRKDAQDPFQWLLDETIAFTPSTAGVSLPAGDYEYEPAEDPVSPGYITKEKREFRQWLVSTGYEGRWRSTDNYRSLSQHDQRVFRNQTKDILRHILRQFVSNDAGLT